MTQNPADLFTRKERQSDRERDRERVGAERQRQRDRDRGRDTDTNRKREAERDRENSVGGTPIAQSGGAQKILAHSKCVTKLPGLETCSKQCKDKKDFRFLLAQYHIYAPPNSLT